MRQKVSARVDSMHGVKTTNESGRLPKNVVPVNYQITLTPELEEGTYLGVVVIE